MLGLIPFHLELLFHRSETYCSHLFNRQPSVQSRKVKQGTLSVLGLVYYEICHDIPILLVRTQYGVATDRPSTVCKIGN